MHFAKFFWKTSLSLLRWFFFKFLTFFRRVLYVSYLKIQQTKNRWIIEILINHFFAMVKASRPKTFETETETRPEIFETETETRKDGSRDQSRDRDQVSRLHHWFLVLIFILAWSHAVENRSSACWRPCWEDASSTHSSEKVSGWSCRSQMWHPPRLGYNTLYPIHGDKVCCDATRGTRGHNSPGTKSLRGCPKVTTHKYLLPNNVTSTICFRKTSGSNMGTPNLLLASGAI